MSDSQGSEGNESSSRVNSSDALTKIPIPKSDPERKALLVVEHEEAEFERDLAYELEKNAELYCRLAR